MQLISHNVRRCPRIPMDSMIPLGQHIHFQRYGPTTIRQRSKAQRRPSFRVRADFESKISM
jgi:hypothetical protein